DTQRSRSSSTSSRSLRSTDVPAYDRAVLVAVGVVLDQSFAGQPHTNGLNGTSAQSRLVRDSLVERVGLLIALALENVQPPRSRLGRPGAALRTRLASDEKIVYGLGRLPEVDAERDRLVEPVDVDRLDPKRLRRAVDRAIPGDYLDMADGLVFVV